MNSKRKLKALTYAEKLKAIEAVKSGLKRKDVAVQFGIHESTLSIILKNKDELLKKQESGESLLCKRRRIAEFPNLEQCLFTWFKQCRNKNISVSGPILKEKAEEFAKSLQIHNFKASNGWLENFKKRHDLAFKKVCGESASVSKEVCTEWKSQLKSLLNGYDPNDVFNADETGLFFKCLPDKTLTFKNEKCHGGKHSKERLTILLCTNSTGTQKLKPLMIGKSKKPRCFAGCRSLPLDYEANKKAWMTGELFRKWLIKTDKQMITEKRKILLFIDNCTAHNDVPPLRAIKVQFLPANTTSQLQPLDQGIIKNFKTFYRKEIVKKMITDMEQNTVSSIHVLHAMRMVDKAWRNVTSNAVKNCFKACGFPVQMQENIEVEGEEWNKCTPPEEWNKCMSHVEITFEEFVTCDDKLATAGTLTEEEIMSTVVHGAEGDDLDEDLNDEPQVPPTTISISEARKAVNTLRCFAEQCSDTEEDIFTSLFKIENKIDIESVNSLKQKKITDFFM
ncbi:tigger transposable element-derived protein 6-like [Leguminivora glycinivorella]|uniref:tigger transposable element-derived protein 6-like n=1 Tax=Leguminivora glycinivorella TaxID=1035111 RepID=UPI00200E2349|nr:tigger transposable element-derived protein 6-like [Leguminivora glycinivorella]